MAAPTYAETQTRIWLPVEVPTAAPPTAGRTRPEVRPRPTGTAGRSVAGRYRLHKVLGRGGMGSVWLATDEMLLRSVAMKQYTLPDDDMNRAWVLSEAQAAAQVCHSGVVGIYDIAVDGSELWIVMEALSGQRLADAIRDQGRLDPGRLVDIALQLLEALQAVHLKGIVHRDVTPGNVQLTRESRVVLTDFGLASRGGTAPPIEPGQFVGSPSYMAPESISDGRFGSASDLFAVGATLYAAVEGRKPFDEITTFSTLEAVKNDVPPPAQHAGCLQPVIEGLLNKDPDARLTLAQAHDLLKTLQSNDRSA